VAGVAAPAVRVRVVPASQSQEQALKVRMAGKLVHERPELLVCGVLDSGWRHHCTSVHESSLNGSRACSARSDRPVSRADVDLAGSQPELPGSEPGRPFPSP